MPTKVPTVTRMKTEPRAALVPARAAAVVDIGTRSRGCPDIFAVGSFQKDLSDATERDDGRQMPRSGLFVPAS
jgi:hypothetical protein